MYDDPTEYNTLTLSLHNYAVNTITPTTHRTLGRKISSKVTFKYLSPLPLSLEVTGCFISFQDKFNPGSILGSLFTFVMATFGTGENSN